MPALLGDAGFGDVATLLQSGNVVLASDLPGPAVGRAVEEAIRERLGMDVAAVVRTRDEVRAVADLDPLGEVAVDGSRSLVAFMTEPPGPGLAELLGSTEPGDDRWAVVGRELYLWCPHGQMDSPLVTALGRGAGRAGDDGAELEHRAEARGAARPLTAGRRGRHPTGAFRAGGGG
ncbi:DUF1697 domain-containing protein [Geodermatophilus sp. SYSU D01106]